MHHSLSLWSAIRININIMLGTGLFINTVNLARIAGPFGALSYGIVGLILSPLIITIARLVELHPQGGFYRFGSQELSPLAGFLSAWIYFAGKLASASLMIHAGTTLLRLIIPSLQYIPHLVFDIMLIVFFAALNSSNLRLGNTIQTFFFNAKLIPIITILLIAIGYFNPINYTTYFATIGDFITTIPLILYATIGFESACALSGRLENPKINGPRAIIISYTVLIITYCLFQAALYGILGSQLSSLASFADVFEAVTLYLPIPVQQYFATLLSLCVALSALGGAYGILFANMWNLHALAEHNHLWKSPLFKKLSIHQVPLWCVGAEAALCCSYILLSNGTLLPLQQISSLGSVVAYTISCLAALYATKRGSLRLSRYIPIFALINCIMLMSICSAYLIQGGNPALYLFVGLIIMGCTMFWIQKKAYIN